MVGWQPAVQNFDQIMEIIILIILSNFVKYSKTGFLAQLLRCPQPRDEASVGLLGDLAELPGHQLVAVDQEGEEVEEETVSHVEDTASLGEDNPDQAEPPEVQSSEGCSQDVAERAGEEVTKDVLYGVTFTVVLGLSPG